MTSSKLNANATITNANHAANADKLGGSPAADFRLHCPNGMLQAGNLCVDFNTRTPATLLNALATCASAQLRLADAGELALAFNNLGAPQPPEWTGDVFLSAATTFGLELEDSPSRQIQLNQQDVNVASSYRCVTSPSN